MSYAAAPRETCGRNANLSSGAVVCRHRACRPLEHRIEQEIRLNSITGPYDDAGNGQGQPDGVLRAWVDEHLAFEATDMVWTHHPYMGVQAAWIIFMHGGVKASLSTQRFELGPVVISDERIKT